MKRRDFIKLSLLGSAGLASIGLYAWQIEPFWVEYNRLDMPIPNLPQSLIGKKLVHLSDLHIGNRFNYQYILDVMRKIDKESPHFVVYTGDFVSYENSEQIEQLAKVAPQFAKGKLGTFGVLGNHDYGERFKEMKVAEQVSETLNQNGINILRNQTIGSSDLQISGIDDFWSPNYKPNDLIKNLDLQKPNLVLCHNPDVCDEPIWGDYNSWILSGHTHGGQVKSPFLPPFILPVKNKKYTSGKIPLNNNRTLYINRALGHLHQLRFNVRPEVIIFTLKST